MERKVMLIIFSVFAVVVTVVLCSILIDSGLAEECYVLCRPGSVVNVRNAPKASAIVTAWVECGQRVESDGKKKNGFIHVSGLASEEPDGWIYAGYLVDEEPRIETYRAEVWEGDVIARKCVGGQRIRKLREGQKVTVYAQTHRWAVTNKGYIDCDWLKEVDVP